MMAQLKKARSAVRPSVGRMPVWAAVAMIGVALQMAAAPALAQRSLDRAGGAGGRQNYGAGLANRLSTLDLTAEQQEKVNQIRDEGRRDRQVRSVDLKRLRAEMRAEMLKATPDAKRVQGVAKEISQLRGEQQISRLNQQLTTRSVLTSEQQTKLLSMRSGGWGYGGRQGCDGDRGRSARCDQQGRGRGMMRMHGGRNCR